MTTQTATVTTDCPDCGGRTRQAFPQSDRYVTCMRCGHVHPLLTFPGLPPITGVGPVITAVES